MDQATLVGPDISVGREALAALDAGNVECVVALLAIFPEYGDWRFVISSPSLDQTHPLKSQDKVAEVLASRFVYSLPIVMTLPVRDPFVKGLRKIFGKAAREEGMRLGGQTIGNRFIESAYVYRIR